MIKKNNFEINVRDFESISCEISNKKTSKKDKLCRRTIIHKACNILSQ